MRYKCPERDVRSRPDARKHVRTHNSERFVRIFAQLEPARGIPEICSRVPGSSEDESGIAVDSHLVWERQGIKSFEANRPT